MPVADSVVPKRDGCTSISQSEVGAELATPKLQSFVQQSLMGPPLARLRQCTGLSSARLRSSRICFRCNRIWLQKFWVYWDMFNWNLLLVHDALDSPREGSWQPKLPRSVLPVPSGSSQNYVPNDHYFHPPRAKASCVSTYL